MRQLGIETQTTRFPSEITTALPDGSFKVILGAFDVYSGNGHYYELTDITRAIYSEGSVFQNRVANGEVKVEMGHPSPTGYNNMVDYLTRLMSTDEDNVCGTITWVKLDTTPTVVTGQPTPVYLVKGHIKPSGKHAKFLKTLLMSPVSDIAFSVRGLNYTKTVGGMLYKEIHTVMTYDAVKVPGISMASKSQWSNFSLESMGELVLDKYDIQTLINKLGEREMVATESESRMIADIKSKLSGCDDDSCIYKAWQ